MMWAGFTEANNPAWFKHSEKFTKNLILIRYMMKCIKTNDPIDGFVFYLKTMAIKINEPGGLERLTNDGEIVKELFAYVQSCD